MPTALQAMTAKVFTTSCQCPNCGGTGKLPHYSHIANGDCFACQGTGTLRLRDFIGSNRDVVLDVEMLRGKFWHAWLRCRTWTNDSSTINGVKQNYHNWGRDLWCIRIDDVHQARALWKKAKAMGIQATILD